jgi:expansin (peptidoglycan-binding protein)
MAPGQHSGRRGRWRTRWPWLGLGGAAAVLAMILLVAGVGQAGGRACAATVTVGGQEAAAGTVTGTATHYVLSGTGNCSYPSPPANGLFVALSPSEYDGAATCGEYVEVSGPDGSVTAEVIDQCPPCAAGHVDLSETAFARIAPLSAGLVPISYRPLTDPALPGPVSIRVKEGSSAYWLALLAGNTGNPLASVQVEDAAGAWHDLARASYNYWIAASGAGPGPFTVRLTDTAGHQVTAHGIALKPGNVQDTGILMYGAGRQAAGPAGPTTMASSPAARATTRPSRASVRITASPLGSRPASAPDLDQVLVAPPRPARTARC